MTTAYNIPHCTELHSTGWKQDLIKFQFQIFINWLGQGFEQYQKVMCKQE